MVKFSIKNLMAASVLSAMVFVCGCQTDAQSGSIIGSLAGAGIGQLAGGDTEATLIGAAIGAGTGYIFGNESDKEKTATQMYALRAEQNTTVVWVTNTNGSKIPVRLARNGPAYTGPRGEIYPQLPSQDQLRMVYGF